MSLLDNVIAFCKDDLAHRVDQLEHLKSGHKLQSNDGTGWKDVTDEWVKIHEAKISELKAFVAKHSGAQ